MTERNLQVRLASRPSGVPTPENFRITEEDVLPPRDGEFIVRGRYLSLDPYMRGRMSDGPSYVPPVVVGDVMCGEQVGEVVASQHPEFPVGTRVSSDFGWQLYARSTGKGVRRLDPSVPLSANLSLVGMPGATAWIGLVGIGQPKAGETVVVSAAAGAVGGIVGQIAKILGCRAIGIAGGADKCRYVVDELGFDACLDYKSPQFRADFKAAVPNGVDIYFDNVGGEVLDTVLTRLNPNARIPLCGLISQYNATEAYGVKNFRSLLINRVRVQGFIVTDQREQWPRAFEELNRWRMEGRLRGRETVAQGLRAAPEAFLGLLRGANVGKQLVDLAPGRA